MPKSALMEWKRAGVTLLVTTVLALGQLSGVAATNHQLVHEETFSMATSTCEGVSCRHQIVGSNETFGLAAHATCSKGVHYGSPEKGEQSRMRYSFTCLGLMSSSVRDRCHSRRLDHFFRVRPICIYFLFRVFVFRRPAARDNWVQLWRLVKALLRTIPPPPPATHFCGTRTPYALQFCRRLCRASLANLMQSTKVKYWPCLLWREKI